MLQGAGSRAPLARPVRHRWAPRSYIGEFGFDDDVETEQAEGADEEEWWEEEEDDDDEEGDEEGDDVDDEMDGLDYGSDGEVADFEEVVAIGMYPPQYLIDEMQPRRISYHQNLAILSRKGKFNRVSRVLSEMIAEELHPGPYACHALVFAHVVAGDGEGAYGALQLIEQARESRSVDGAVVWGPCHVERCQPRHRSRLHRRHASAPAQDWRRWRSRCAWS